MTFNVGDMVRVCGVGGDTPPLGLVGKVVFEEDDDRHVKVDFYPNWRLGGEHYDDRGNLIGRQTWWVLKDHLEREHKEANFYLIGIVDGAEVTLDEAGFFETGKQAAERAKALSELRGYKVQPRRVQKDDVSWKAREETRLRDGTYTPMPEGWDLQPIPDHFLHRSVKSRDNVAYTDSHERGVIDKQTSIKVGRYLERFYPHLTEAQRQGYIAVVDEPEKVQFAVTADEIEDVYRSGPDSCMSKDMCDYESAVHPVRVYGDSDLQLAYITDEDDNITSRCLVWPERKVIGRIYGDEYRMRRALEAVGYKQGGTDCFQGARITKIVDEGKYVLPYIDWQCLVHDPEPDEENGWLVIDRLGNVCANNTSGIAIRPRMCPKLNRISRGPFRYVEDAGEEWSEEAINRYATHIYVERKGYQWRSTASLVHIEGGGYMIPEEAERRAFRSAYDGLWYLNRRRHVLPNGDAVTQSQFNNYYFTCAGFQEPRQYEHSRDRVIGAKRYSAEYVRLHPEAIANLQREQDEEARQAEQRLEQVTAEEAITSTIAASRLINSDDFLKVVNDTRAYLLSMPNRVRYPSLDFDSVEFVPMDGSRRRG